MFLNKTVYAFRTEEGSTFLANVVFLSGETTDPTYLVLQSDFLPHGGGQEIIQLFFSDPRTDPAAEVQIEGKIAWLNHPYATFETAEEAEAIKIKARVEKRQNRKLLKRGQARQDLEPAEEPEPVAEAPQDAGGGPITETAPQGGDQGPPRTEEPAKETAPATGTTDKPKETSGKGKR